MCKLLNVSLLALNKIHFDFISFSNFLVSFTCSHSLPLRWNSMVALGIDHLHPRLPPQSLPII